MSTRCQVFVTGKDINNSDSVMLYHHYDGYPDHMLPTIARGHIDTWEAERVGKAAAMVCAADPTGFEIEQSYNIHGDIEFYYVVDVNGGDWAIAAYACPYGSKSVTDMDKIGVYSVTEALEK